MRKTFSTVVTFLSFSFCALAQSAPTSGFLRLPFVIPMPEPSLPALLAVDLGAVAAIVGIIRWRANRKAKSDRQA